MNFSINQESHLEITVFDLLRLRFDKSPCQIQHCCRHVVYFHSLLPQIAKLIPCSKHILNAQVSIRSPCCKSFYHLFEAGYLNRIQVGNGSIAQNATQNKKATLSSRRQKWYPSLALIIYLCLHYLGVCLQKVQEGLPKRC